MKGVAIYAFKRAFVTFGVPIGIAWMAFKFDRVYLKEVESSFRDKSAMYGKDLKESDSPSW